MNFVFHWHFTGFVEIANMRKKIALIVSTPMTFYAFYKNHIEFLSVNYDVTLIANFDGDQCKIQGVKYISVALERKPKPIQDLIVLIELIKIFKKEKFDVVHSTTPKAGLLTQLAAKFAGVNTRIHIFTGQVWANKSGIKRWLYKKFDSLIALFASHLLADSHSQKQFLIAEGIPVENKIKVIGDGSISGVDLNKFNPKNRDEIREKLGLPSDSFIFLFIGRLNFDKGIIDLIKSFESIAESNNDAFLVVVGADEDNLLPVIKSNMLYNKRIFYYEFTTRPEDFMSMADVLCLPSYREGFGSVIIESAACGTPSIGSNIYGLSDAIVDGETGLLFKVGDVSDLAEKMMFFSSNNQAVEKMSNNGLIRAKTDFDADVSSKLLRDYYKSVIGA